MRLIPMMIEIQDKHSGYSKQQRKQAKNLVRQAAVIVEQHIKASKALDRAERIVSGKLRSVSDGS